MKTFLFVAALAIPLPCQQLTVEPLCWTICTGAWWDITGPVPVAKQVSYCGSVQVDIAVIAVSLSSLPCDPFGSSLLIDPADIVFVELMDVTATTHTFSLPVPPALGPITWSQQAFYWSTFHDSVWTVPEAWRFSIQ